MRGIFTGINKRVTGTKLLFLDKDRFHMRHPDGREDKGQNTWNKSQWEAGGWKLTPINLENE